MGRPPKFPKPAPPSNVVKLNVFDPEQVNIRLYKQVSALLKQLEDKKTITLRERIAALMAIGRLQQLFANMRKGEFSDPSRSGATVRKYQSAFSHAAGRGETDSGSAEATDPAGDDWFEHAERSEPDDDDTAE